jgi:cytochrome c556
MKRLACAVSALAVLVLTAGADDAETPTAKQLMNKLHKGANAPVTRLQTALKSDTPDWKAVRGASKDLVVLGEGLPKTRPSKGDTANYEKLANAYYADAKALDAAAKIEDKPKAQAALKKLGASCKTCHTAHKGK